jgi:hypothetical protein
LPGPPKEDIDVIEDGEKDSAARNELHGKLDCILGDAGLESFYSAARNTDTGIAQHEHNTRTCPRNFEEKAEDKGEDIGSPITNESKHADS